MKRVILVHGWQGCPGNHWKGWFRRELEARGIEVVEPNMPNDSNRPEDWILKLQSVVGKPDENTVIVGHSLGCPTAIGYLMTLREREKIAGAVLVAGFVSKLSGYKPLYLWDFNLEEVKEAKKHCNKFVSIGSTNDIDVPMEKVEELNNLVSGKLIAEDNKCHFCEDDGVTELPSALDAVLEILTLQSLTPSTT